MRTIALEEHFASPNFLDGRDTNSHRALKFGAAAAKLFLNNSVMLARKELRKWMPQGSMCRCFRSLLPALNSSKGTMRWRLPRVK